MFERETEKEKENQEAHRRKNMSKRVSGSEEMENSFILRNTPPIKSQGFSLQQTRVRERCEG